MSSEHQKLRNILHAVHRGYAAGDNIMDLARTLLEEKHNDPVSTLLSYDLRAGRFNEWYRSHKTEWRRWSDQIAALIQAYLPAKGSLLEVGCGEASTLAGVLTALQDSTLNAFGFDISWSRITEGNKWLQETNQAARLFVGDLFHIPMGNDSIDVVYSSHSLEPNGGREEVALRECLRVARRAVVLVEPIYELATPAQQERMARYGYVRGLKHVAEQLGETIAEYRMLDFSLNPMNSSGLLIIVKPNDQSDQTDTSLRWQCPLTEEPLVDLSDVFCAPSLGIVYPVVRDVPMLRPGHAIVASKLYRD
jgi:ubiquinone/menaquinone biosynthesis C-methylase UbiE